MRLVVKANPAVTITHIVETMPALYPIEPDGKEYLASEVETVED